MHITIKKTIKKSYNKTKATNKLFIAFVLL